MISIVNFLYEFNSFFDYTKISKQMWNELISNAKKDFNIFFDLENNDYYKQERIIKIPQKQSNTTDCKFRCQLWTAGGDWEVPLYYFKCQLVSGYTLNVKTYDKYGGCFVFIPGKEEGNYHLIKDKDRWIVPDNNNYKENIDPQKNDRDCWKSLNNYLEKLVKLEIEDLKNKNGLQ